MGALGFFSTAYPLRGATFFVAETDFILTYVLFLVVRGFKVDATEL
jgi:hypothetical protein